LNSSSNTGGCKQEPTQDDNFSNTVTDNSVNQQNQMKPSIKESKVPKSNPIKNNTIVQKPKYYTTMDLSSISTSLNSIPSQKLDSLNQSQQDLFDVPQMDVELLTKLVESADRYINIERIKELEYMRNSIIEAYLFIWPSTNDKIQKRQQEKQPMRLATPTKEESTEKSIEIILPLIMDVVKCSKFIPGFNQISQHDQVKLLKQGSFEVICLNSFNLVDCQNKCMLTPDLESVMDA
jgi:hypothetical protein